jgi:Cof subfamily protein (haloacid dehalogenase superfamily)
VWEDGILRPRTTRALQLARDAGLHVIVVTGRMYRSVHRFLEPAQLPDPVICYQGAAVVGPDGAWLRHEPIELELARETIAALAEEGCSPNVYVHDELYVARVTQGAREYAEFQELEIHEAGDLLEWLAEPPTKLVCVGDPEWLDGLEVRMKQRFEGRLYISKSLPYFLEFAAPDVTKAAGLEFLARRMGFNADETIAFGDGENDVELVAWAGYGVAVANAHDRVKEAARWICPPASEEGVAQVLEALLDSGS